MYFGDVIYSPFLVLDAGLSLVRLDESEECILFIMLKDVVIVFQGPASASSMMPTAAAVAAAAATAKIQAMDAVASNAVALGKCRIVA